MLYREIIEIETEKDKSYDITKKVAEIVKNSDLHEGLCNIFLKGTTAGLIINENEQMLNADFLRMFREIDEKRLCNHPSNGFSHLRAGMLDTEKTMPVANGKLILGTWQNILLWEFDAEGRKREIIVSISGP